MYRVQLTPAASASFGRLHPDIRKQIKAALKILEKEPFSGKALLPPLDGLRSLKMKRYRAVYQIHDEHRSVIILAISHRRQIYDIVSALLAT